jgi:creatinine amidohydrolase
VSGRAGRRATLIEEITSAEFAKLAKKKPLVIVPFGSVEEHGSHLPLCTDAFQAEEIALRIAERFDALVCPSVKYGECVSTRNFPGTISVSSETLRLLVRDLVSELARNGIDKIMILTGHAGGAHMAALKEGAMGVVAKDKSLKVMLLSDYDIAYQLLGKEVPATDGHGGLIETSRIMNIRPELVGTTRPKGTDTRPKFMLVPDAEKYNPTGIVGDSSWASAETGKKMDDYIVKELSKLVAENFGLKPAR